MPELIELARFISDDEANITIGLLKSAGIHAVLSSDNMGGMRPELNYIGGSRVLVPEPDLKKARELIESASEISDEELERQAMAAKPED